MTRRNRALPWIALVVVYLVWGSTYLGIRVAVETIPPYLMTGVRYFVAGSLMFALQWVVTKGKPALPSRAELVRIAIVAVLLLVLGNGLLCVAETRVESGTAALLLAGTLRFGCCFSTRCARRTAPSGAAIGGLVLGTAGASAVLPSARAPATRTCSLPVSFSLRRSRGRPDRFTPEGTTTNRRPRR